MTKTTLSVLFLLLFTASLRADEPLAWKLTQGETLVYTATQEAVSTIHVPGNPVQSIAKQVMQIAWNVESIDEQGGARIRQDVRRAIVEVEAPGGAGYKIDTNSDEPPMGMGALVGPFFKAIVAHDTTFTLSAQGMVTDLEAPEELLSALKNMPGAALGGSSDAMLKQMCQANIVVLEKGPLEVGQTWKRSLKLTMPMIGAQEVETTYTYQGDRDVEGRSLAVLAPTQKILQREEGAAPVEMTMDVLESDGEAFFDREQGRLVSMNTRQKTDLSIITAGQTITGVVEQTVKVVTGEGELPEAQEEAEEETAEEE